MGRFKALMLSVLVALSAAASSKADVIVTLEAFLNGGEPVSGPVAAGTDVVVDLLLSVDAEDDPLADVRLIQFDFESTGSGIELVSFTWTVDTEGYSFQDPDLPLTNVTSIALGSSSQLLALTSNPVKVASMELRVNATATLDSVSAEQAEGDFGAHIMAGFADPENFGPEYSNLQGGNFEFSVPGGGGGGGGGAPTDTDGDGVGDDEDAFPEDPDETTDTNDDGVGNNEDPDDDSDGVDDGDDDFPVDPGESEDTDGNGVGNNADPDDDGDGVADDDDSAPLDPSEGGQANDNTNYQGGGPRACGAGLIGPAIFMFLGLGLLSCRPRRGI